MIGQRLNSIQKLLFAGVLTILTLGGGYVLYALAAPFFRVTQSTNVEVYTSLPMQLTTGRAISNGIRLAFEEHQYQAGDANVQLVMNDDGDATGAWSTDLEKANAEKAVADPRAIAYIGTFNSGAAKVSVPILNEGGMLEISPGNTWPGLTKPGFLPGEPGVFYPTGVRNYFRVCTTDDNQGPAGALWAKELGFKSVYVIDDSDVYGTGIADLFTDEADTLGLTIDGRAHLLKTSPDFEASTTALVADILKKKPDLVYYGGITPNGGPELLSMLRAAGAKEAFMGPDGILEQDFIDRAGAANADGVYATTIGVPPAEMDNDAAKAFNDAYTKRFGEAPDVFSAFGYEAANVTLQAISKAPQKTRALVLQEMRTMQSWSGVLGTWSFDENGDTNAILLSGNRVIDGHFTFVKKLSVP
jgi:branched-chain amino acid transport system substrate-binding protein